MKRLTRGIFAVIALISVALTAAIGATPYTVSSSGGKLRTTVSVGLIIPYEDTELALTLWGLLRAFSEEGYIDGTVYNNGLPSDMWDEACEIAGGALTLMPDACYNLAKMTDADYRAMLARTDIDLMLVLGSRAGGVVSKLDARFDYMVLGADDPVGSGIVESAENPGEGRWAVICPDRFGTQIKALNDMGFGVKLGFVIDSDKNSQPTSEKIYTAAADYGFVCETRTIEPPGSAEDYEEYRDEYFKNAEELLDSCGILIITYNYLTNEDYHKLFQLCIDKKVLSCSFCGDVPAQYGCTMSISMSDDYEVGRFAARAVTSYMNGEALDLIGQVFPSTPSISYNYKTVTEMEMFFDYKSLLTAESIYITIR